MTGTTRNAARTARPSCSDCGKPMDLDHIKPKRWGGGNEPSNLRYVCPRENRSRGDDTRGPALICSRCGCIYRRSGVLHDELCDKCQKAVMARARRLEGAALRKKASEWKRKRALEARKALRRRERGRWD